MVIPLVDGSYCQMAKQSHENYKFKVIFGGNIINTTNYFHWAE
jgi:hypothetical protein